MRGVNGGLHRWLPRNDRLAARRAQSKQRSYTEVALTAKAPGVRNPDIRAEQLRGRGVLRLDHFQLYAPNIAKAERCCREVLHILVPKVCNLPDGKRFATWITGSNKPHDLAFVEYAQAGKIHHVGFLLQDWNHVGQVADLIAINRLKRTWAPRATPSRAGKPSISGRPPATASGCMRAVIPPTRITPSACGMRINLAAACSTARAGPGPVSCKS